MSEAEFSGNSAQHKKRSPARSPGPKLQAGLQGDGLDTACLIIGRALLSVMHRYFYPCDISSLRRSRNIRLVSSILSIGNLPKCLDRSPLKWSNLKYVFRHQGRSGHAKEETHARRDRRQGCGTHHHRELALLLQHAPATRVARLQTTSPRSHHPCNRAVGCTTSTGFAARTGAKTVIAPTFHPDHSMGADQPLPSNVLDSAGDCTNLCLLVA